MGNLVSTGLGIIGAGIGAMIGGPTGAEIGWTLGSMAGNEIDPTKQPTQYGPRLSDLNVQSSAYGSPIPEMFGSMRLAGNIIWSSGLKEHKHESGGGKKSGGQSSVTYTYTASFAVGLGVGPVGGIRRIWADSTLLLDLSTSAGAEKLLSNPYVHVGGATGALETDIQKKRVSIGVPDTGQLYQGLTLYLGTETQMPDPVIEAVEGVGNVPAHRGLVYLVFQDLQLKNYGNRIPNITVEVVQEGTASVGTATENYAEVPSSWYLAHAGGMPTSLWSYYPGIVQVRDGVITEVQAVRGQAGGGGGSVAFASYTISGKYVSRWWFSANGGDIYTPVLGSTDLLHGAYTSAAIPPYTYYWVDAKGVKKASDPLKTKHGTLRSLSGAVSVKSTLFVLSDDGSEVYRTFGETYMETIITSPMAISGIAVDVRSECIVTRTGATLTYYAIDGLQVDQVTLSNPSIADPYQLCGEWYFAADGTMYQVVGGQVTDYGNPPYYGQDTSNQHTGMFIDGQPYLAYRVGTAYYGGLVTPTAISLDKVVRRLCNEAGLADADIDVSQLAGTVCSGYTRTGPMSARKAIEPLMKTYFFDAAETDGLIQFVPRGQASVVSIPEGDLSASAGQNPTMPDPITRVRQDDQQLPRRVQVQYYNPAADYQTGQQEADRLITQVVNETPVQLPIVMTDNKARQVAEVLLYDAWQARTSYTILLPPQYAYLDPADVITVTVGGVVYTLRITSISFALPGLLTVQGVADEPTVYQSDAVGGAAQVPTYQASGFPGPTFLTLLDSALVSDLDDTDGMYWVAGAYYESWHGALLYQSKDEGNTYAIVDGATASAIVGAATDVLPDGPTTVWDEGSTVTVQLSEGSLSGSNDLNVLNGANMALLGAVGRWEVLAFGEATLNTDGSYTLSRLLRGLRGTEWATGTHQVGDTVVLVSRQTMQRLGLPQSDIGKELDYKAVSVDGKTLDQVTAQALTFEAAGLKPYSPCHVTGRRDGSGSLTIDWVRRTRVGGEWRDAVDASLGEATESYEVDVYNGSTVVRTLSASTPTVTYTAGQQTTDFGSTQASIKVAIYQLSATTGRGYGKEVTL